MERILYTVIEYLQAGGPVMLPILLVSLLMWFLIIDRVLFMRRLFFKNIPRAKAGKYVQLNKSPEQKFRGVNATLVREFLSNRTGNRELDDYILDEVVLKMSSSVEKYLTLISVLSRVAPLLGLLGTVTGMMVTFDVITVFGTGNARAMAGGISEALITTQTGLLVSIPGLYMSGFLQKRSINLKHRIAATGIYLKRFI
ncbi:MAG: biopolymer transport protein ExbB [Candidatus Magnetoglobus multicellularis str. Araruama]|uniref:Biopolymer transport protein ExbB n=1 Tax=Candidatus Magnetoglobus multicellularis str. Araruama TaxID=890399 RepID=A0A1V1P9J9_9BACT|nr:MAG: biopolymer transport protein ExbB [Candidatus Magnetoglobus multicellularis str. Araruama]